MTHTFPLTHRYIYVILLTGLAIMLVPRFASGTSRRLDVNEQLDLGLPADGLANPHPVQNGGDAPVLKTCTSCHLRKPLAEFYQRTSSGDGRAGWCKVCTNRYVREWKKINKGKVLKNRREWKAANRDKITAQTRAWHAANKDKVNAIHHARRARLIGAAGWGYTKAQHIAWRWELFGGKCWMCGADADHTDHVIPLGAGGSHWPSNLRPACLTCNSSRPKNGADLPTRKTKRNTR